jgi:hypothetical protein
MANHELPEWENTPSTPATQRGSFWQRLSQPFTSKNPFLSTPQPTVDHKNTLYGTKSPLTRTQNFDKETGAAEPTAETSTTTEISPRGNGRRYCGHRPRSILLIILAAVLLLALIIGLAVGLSHKSYVGLNTFINNLPI